MRKVRRDEEEAALSQSADAKNADSRRARLITTHDRAYLHRRSEKIVRES